MFIEGQSKEENLKNLQQIINLTIFMAYAAYAFGLFFLQLIV